jgi:serine protease Do
MRSVIGLILKTTLIPLMLAVFTIIPPAGASTESGEPFGISSEDGGGSSYLGVDTRDITPDRLGPLQLKEERGVEVTMVDQDAPAGKAGLKEHDVILNINGQEVQSVEQLRRMIREVPPGRVVSIGLSRNGQPLTLKAQLAARKGFAFGPDAKNFHFAVPPIPPVPPMPQMPDIDVPISIVVVHSSVRSGLMVENLTPQLGDFLGAKNGQGVLVRSVEKGSRAEKAGFRAGDVITRVNGESINDSGDFSHALRGRKDNTVSVSIIRDKKEQTLTLTLPDRKQSDLFEESFAGPETGAEHVDLSDLTTELAQIKPQMELAERDLQRMKPELKKQEQECRFQEKKVKEQMEKMRRDLRGQQEQMRKQLREMLGSRADI